MRSRDHRRLRAVLAVLAAMAIIGACSKKKSAETENVGDQAAPVEEAPPIVVAMTQAHGGMVGWRTARSISFDAELAGGGSDSIVAVYHTIVDPAKGRMAVSVDGNDQRMGWDGKQVWNLGWTQAYAPHFVAELDYYLLNLPWLAMDPASKLAVAAKDTLWGDPKEYSVVKMTPAARAGLRPGSYRLYIDPETKQLRACRFTSAPTPGSVQEFVLVYEEYSKAEGMVLPSQVTMYAGDYTPVMVATFRDWKLDQAFDPGRSAMPDSAVVNESVP